MKLIVKTVLVRESSASVNAQVSQNTRLGTNRNIERSK